jgi:hypothetical protein
MPEAAKELGSAIVIDVENGWNGESELFVSELIKLCKREPMGLATSFCPERPMLGSSDQLTYRRRI